MRIKITSFFIFFSALFLILFFSAIKMGESKIKDAAGMRQEDEIIVKFKESGDINLVKIARAEDFEKILASYNKNPDVEYAEPNFLYRATIIPSDTYYNNQWHLAKIKAQEAWNETRESPGIVIAIIDSGAQITHPDLKDNIWRNNGELEENGIDDDKNGFIDDINGWDFVNNVADPSPKFKGEFTEAGILHGTIVAGVAAASGNNAAGVTGITWRARIMPLKVLDDKGEGNTNSVVKAIDYAIANGADIINFSFVGFGYSQSLDNAIKRAYDAGIIIVAAAGNEQDEGVGYSLDNTPMYPVCHDGTKFENRIIGVAATDTIDQKTVFSSYGFNCVDISAPGLSIFSTVVYSPTNRIGEKSFNSYYDGYWSGTSMAAPMVSAAAALVEAANPELNRGEVAGVIIDTADNINKLNPTYLNQLGRGRLNLQAAITSAKFTLNSKTAKILSAPYANYLSMVKITDQNGAADLNFDSYGSSFRGGVSVAGGDMDGDGQDEIITGAGPGGGPHVRIFDYRGSVKGQFFAFAENIRGGINVAACDTDNDGKEEILVSNRTAGNEVRVFDYKGNLKYRFSAYASNFQGGVNIACGDIDGDGHNEIVTGAGPGGGPQVRIFRPDGYVEGQFFAYAQSFRGGVSVAVADVNGGTRGSKKEIVTGAGPGGGPHVRIFDSRASLKGQFFAYSSGFTGGVNVAAADMDNDGLDEIITGAGPGGAPHVRVFKANGKLTGSFYAFEEKFNSGVNVGTIKIKN